jgi:XRE family transcriptional regulator, aerobic/anaerobic benzoate catabolism transcriptional regulator
LTDDQISSEAGEGKHPALVVLGERVRSLRSRRGMTRRALAAAADVSERHLANLEYGVGNASFLILQQVAQALECSMAELVGDVTASSPEWLMLREMLQGRNDDTLRQVRMAVAKLLGEGGHADPAATAAKRQRIALVGLRGAGKSTLGKRLGDAMGWPFIELNRSIERLAGCSVAEIQALYGQNAYRRYERRALEEALREHAQCVIASPGGIVSDPATFNLLLDQCTTVWLEATPEDHMRRVVAQGDMRPMGASSKRAMNEAMEDMRSILTGRRPFYSKADYALNTSAQDLDATFAILLERVSEHLRESRVTT